MFVAKATSRSTWVELGRDIHGGDVFKTHRVAVSQKYEEPFRSVSVTTAINDNRRVSGQQSVDPSDDR